MLLKKNTVNFLVGNPEIDSTFYLIIEDDDRMCSCKRDPKSRGGTDNMRSLIIVKRCCIHGYCVNAKVLIICLHAHAMYGTTAESNFL